MNLISPKIYYCPFKKFLNAINIFKLIVITPIFKVIDLKSWILYKIALWYLLSPCIVSVYEILNAVYGHLKPINSQGRISAFKRAFNKFKSVIFS